MKAVVATRYGGPEVLEYKEVPDPVPGPKDALIKIRAASVLAGDCEIRRFQLHPLFWLPVRLLVGVFKPRVGIYGQELAGEVLSVGSKRKDLKVGDKVFGICAFTGGHAELYKASPAATLEALPQNFTFDEAAGMSVGGLNALHFLRIAKIQPGQRVLVYGSTGSIGVAAVQMAKAMGARVEAVCGPEDGALVQSLGAEAWYDFNLPVYAPERGEFDVVFDTIGKSPYKESLGAVKKGGVYLQANPTMGFMVRSLWHPLVSGKKVIWRFAGDFKRDLPIVREMMEKGQLKPVVDRSYPLEETPQAHRYVDLGHKKGAVIITVD